MPKTTLDNMIAQFEICFPGNDRKRIAGYEVRACPDLPGFLFVLKTHR
jgi:hypothetical protein